MLCGSLGLSFNIKYVLLYFKLKYLNKCDLLKKTYCNLYKITMQNTNQSNGYYISIISVQTPYSMQ